jgi:hypothetical protein
MQAAPRKGSARYRRAGGETRTLNDRDITGLRQWRLGGNPVVSHGR